MMVGRWSFPFGSRLIFRGFVVELGGWTNPSEKYARQIRFIFPNFSGWKFKDTFELPLPRIDGLVFGSTPWKINGWNLKITCLKRNMKASNLKMDGWNHQFFRRYISFQVGYSFHMVSHFWFATPNFPADCWRPKIEVSCPDSSNKTPRECGLFGRVSRYQSSPEAV